MIQFPSASLMLLEIVIDEMSDALQTDQKKERLILMRVICDYIAGMTDAYAQKAYEDLYG